VLEGLTVDAALMARRAGDGYAQATDLAEVIMGARGVNYRDAHRVVGLVVRLALERGLPLRAVDAGLVDEAAREVLGAPLDLPPAVLAGAVDPEQVVESRTGRGGAAPEAVRAMIDECRDELRRAEAWRLDAHARLEAAEGLLVARAADLCRGSTAGSTRPTREET
jgi:argininosuccinate lyase